MTGLQLAILCGLLAGAGATMLLVRLTPADPDLGDVLDRLSPQGRRQATFAQDHAVPDVGDTRERLGLWGMRRLPPALWSRVPREDLLVLDKPLHRFYGEKLFFALCGLALGPVWLLMLLVLRFDLPVGLPVGASLALAAFMFIAPDLEVREQAARSRYEFGRAIVAYADLVAMARQSGYQSRQAMEEAATIGNSRPFRRIAQELTRSRLSGEPPWTSLRGLADDLRVPELAELADIMRLSGEHGVGVYDTLRARVDALRDMTAKSGHGDAREITVKLTSRITVLAITVATVLVMPLALRLMLG